MFNGIFVADSRKKELKSKQYDNGNNTYGNILLISRQVMRAQTGDGVFPAFFIVRHALVCDFM